MIPMSPLPDWPDYPIITASEAARCLGVDPVSVYRAVERGDIEGYRSGASWLVVTASARAWVKVGHRRQTIRRNPLRSARMKARVVAQNAAKEKKNSAS